MANFTDLPREIRDQIYKLLLTVGAEIVAHPTYFQKRTNFEAEGANRPAVALLRLNKQIGGEAAVVLYGNNTWRIADSDRDARGSEIYEKYGNLFRHVTVHLDRRDTDEFFTTLRIEQTYERLASLKMDKRIKDTHDHRSEILDQFICARRSLIEDHMTYIQSLTLVVDNLYCPSGCCRFDIIRNLYRDFLHTFDPYRKSKHLLPLCPQWLEDVRVTGLIFQAERDLVYGKWGFQGAAVEEGTA